MNIQAAASDSDGTVSKVEFFVNGTSIGVDNASPYAAVWTAVQGTAVISAVATDDKGATGADSITVIVKDSVVVNKAPVVDITSPVNGAAYTPGSMVNIQAAASDSDGTVSKVEFFVNGTSISADSTSPYAAIWTAVQGTAVISAVATDDKGATGVDSITVIVKDSVIGNKAPVITITSPANGAVFTTGTVVSITAAASDSDGTVSKVEFYVNGVKVGEDATAPYQYNWTSVEGTAELTAVATDDKGAKTTSAIVKITIRKKGNCAGLKVDAGKDQVVKYGYNPQACASLKADAKGGKSPYSYKWSNGKPTMGVTVCPTTTTTYTVTVTDKNGCTATDKVRVCVENVKCETNKVLVCWTYKFHGKVYAKNTYCVSQVTASLLVNYFSNKNSNWNIGSCNSTACGTDSNKDLVDMDFGGEEHLTSEERALIYGASIKLYPNPSSSSAVNLELTNIADEKVQVIVRDILGKVVFNEQVTVNGTVVNKQINLSNELPRGTYMVTVTTGETVVTEKLIIQ